MGLIGAIIFLLAFGWIAATCAMSHETPASLSGLFTSEPPPTPEPTPLPARPMGTMAGHPSAGEPPVGVFSEKEQNEMDALPVGAGTPPPQNEDADSQS